MSDYTISLPDTLYEKAWRLAQQTSQSVDDVIRAHLASALDHPLLELPADERAEIQAMSYLSDDTLWTIAREQMSSELQECMAHLMEKNSQGTITADEHSTLSTLVERGQRLTLRKSQAMKLLLMRGYTVTLEALSPANV